MELVMYVDNEFIGSVSLDTRKITLPGYLGSMKRELLKGNDEVMKYTSQEPEFWVVNLSHSVGQPRTEHQSLGGLHTGINPCLHDFDVRPDLRPAFAGKEGSKARLLSFADLALLSSLPRLKEPLLAFLALARKGFLGCLNRPPSSVLPFRTDL